MKWVFLITVLIILQISSINTMVISVTNFSQDQIYKGNAGEYVPMRYWRYDGEILKVVDSRIFPMASLGQSGSFLNLGVAWITQTMQFEDDLIASFSIFDRGRVNQFTTLQGVYKSVYWNWAQDQLFFIGTTTSQTVLMRIQRGVAAQQFIIETTGTDHEVYLTSTEIRIFMKINGIDPVNFTLDTLTFEFLQESTDEIQISSFPGFGGLFVIENGSLEVQSPEFSRVAPSGFTENSVLGHVLLSPTVFDPSIDKGWNSDSNEVFDLPLNTTNVFPIGFASSLVRTANNTIYEYNRNKWIQLAQFDPKYQPLDFSIIDVDLYMGGIFDNGLQLLLAGADGDNDFVPDIMEGYYFSSSNTADTDKDTIPDNLEIAFGTDPARDDRYEDKDGDKLSNIDEYNSVYEGIQLDPSNRDSDFGGALDGWELNFDYNPYNKTDDLNDDDEDGVNNAVESLWYSDPRDEDSDDDGMPDRWEIQYTLDPINPRNANLDYDNDGRTNLQEYLDGTDPLTPDPPPLYDQVLLVYIAFCLFAIPIVYQIWEHKMEEEI